MDDSRKSASGNAALRVALVGLVALGGAYGGAFLTSTLLAALDAAALLPAALGLEPDGAPLAGRALVTAGGGMAIGLALVASVARAFAPRARAALPAPVASGLPPACARPDPVDSIAALHVVSGPSARRAVAAGATLAASWIARGERVLLIDGGPRLRLHGPLLAEPALGLSECLREGAPLLGVVQSAGVPGFYLLVHGAPIPPRAWAGLGHLLDEARARFDRVVLALDLGAPYEVGRALAGRYVEAWWSDAAPERGAGPQTLAERIGIRWRGMGLDHESKPLLESLRARIEALREAGAPHPEAVHVGAARPPLAPARGAARPPIVLCCDAQVRDRLRFLMWMRRLQRESSGPGRRVASGAPAMAETADRSGALAPAAAG